MTKTTITITSTLATVITNFSFFQGSELAYIYGIVLIIVFPLLTALFSYFAIKYSNSKRREARAPKANQLAKKR